MTFADLYGTELDRRLGSDDTDQLFTTVLRKDAINKAQEWFIEKSGCLWKTASITLVTTVAEYDLEQQITGEEFIGLARQGPDIQITPATGSVRYLAGEDFPRRTIDWLDQEDPGWRTADAATPTGWYVREEAAQTIFGLTPAPLIAAGDTWILRIRHIVQAETMTDDADEPFTLDGTVKTSLRPYHDVLADYGASLMELLRKDLQRSEYFKARAMARVDEYKGEQQAAPTGAVIQLKKRYFTGLREPEPWGARFGRTWG